MKVSIITPSFNSDKTIAKTLESVKNQTYKNIEHIVIDGNSADSTILIVKEYKAILVSEKDKGLYDAMNKGIALASGDIIAILNSDDYFKNEFVIEKIVAGFKEFNVEAILTGVEIFDSVTNKISRTYAIKNWFIWMFRIGWQPPHPGFFVLKTVYNRFGSFNINYKISADFDFLVRALMVHKITYKKLPIFSVLMQQGGISQSGHKARKLANMEAHLALKKNGFTSFYALMWLKYAGKIFQLKAKFFGKL